MIKLFFASLLGLVIISPPHSMAARIGDPAPMLSIERWIKGTPVRPRPGTNVYVVDFWATWCGPCKRSMPLLSDLQRKYASKGVIVLGISDERPDVVAKYVAEQGTAMFYRIGVDTSKRTFQSWMKAYGQNGIPHVFVVDRSGRVAWHGYPDSALEKKIEDLTGGASDDIGSSLEPEDQAAAQYRTLALQAGSAEKAAAFGEKLITDVKDWKIPYALARTILTDPTLRTRDYPLALKASSKAVEMQENSADVLDMHARALYMTGKAEEAAVTQRKAITSNPATTKAAEMRKRLVAYEKAAAPKQDAKVKPEPVP